MAHIKINQLRIDETGQYLIWDFELEGFDPGYDIISDDSPLTINLYIYLNGDKQNMKNYSFSIGSDEDTSSNRVSGVWDLKEEFQCFSNGVVPSVYQFAFQKDNGNELIMASAMISDVNNVYDCMMKNIMELCPAECNSDTVLNDLISEYFILFAHQQAMRLIRTDEALIYFKMIRKCFSKCGNKQYDSDCGCGGNINEHINVLQNNCGCS